ncbi:MAG: hypothetical protein KDA79_16500 [Planctomycetaceae bacterium]|nr:hypothetical protein [Planctomycetaceae bacterium]
MQFSIVRTVPLLLSGLFAVVVPGGCGGGDGASGQNVTVTGTVQYDGGPLREASVQFMSKRTGTTFSADLTENGDYKLELLDVQPGESFDVAVGAPAATQPVEGQPVEVDEAGVPLAPPAPSVPAKYLDPASSGLTATLSDEAEQTFSFTLTSN